MRSRAWARWALVAALLAGCDREQAPAGGSQAPTPASSAPATGEALAATYGRCWGYFNRREFDRYAACFSPRARARSVDESTEKEAHEIVAGARTVVRAFPDVQGVPVLTLVSGAHVVAVVRLTGKHDGSLELGDGRSMPATHAKIDFLMGHNLDYDPATRLAIVERSFLDPTALMGQTGLMHVPHRSLLPADLPGTGTIAVANGTPLEQGNLAAQGAAIDAFNRHDAAAVAAACTAEVAWYDSSMPDDFVGAQIATNLGVAWSAFSDLKIVVDEAFAAGDYAVSLGIVEGTNDGDLSPLGWKATGRQIQTGYLHVVHFRDGKIDQGWRFVNGLTVLHQLGART